jgi:hypothetical protein
MPTISVDEKRIGVAAYLKNRMFATKSDKITENNKN